jgi:hypothetical protein
VDLGRFITADGIELTKIRRAVAGWLPSRGDPADLGRFATADGIELTKIAPARRRAESACGLDQTKIGERE